jgi:hypothetical protein
MKNKKWLIALLLIFPVSQLMAQTTLMTDSGREVIVHEDGSWEFASEDQYVTLPDGQRVRLNPDGSWDEDDNAPAPVQRAVAPVTLQPQQSQPFYSPLEFGVEELAIEIHKEKVHKNTRTETNTVVLVKVELARGETSPRTLNLSRQGVLLEDSAGKEYDILSVLPERLTVQPGEESFFEIRAEDSPSWRLGKHYEIILDENLTGIGEEVELEVPLSMAVNKQLEI